MSLSSGRYCQETHHHFDTMKSKDFCVVKNKTKMNSRYFFKLRENISEKYFKINVLNISRNQTNLESMNK